MRVVARDDREGSLEKQPSQNQDESDRFVSSAIPSYENISSQKAQHHGVCQVVRLQQHESKAERKGFSHRPLPERELNLRPERPVITPEEHQTKEGCQHGRQQEEHGYSQDMRGLLD